MMVLASSYFVYSLSQNNVYNNAVAQKNQLNVDRLSESAQVINTTYTPYTDGKVTVYAQIKNIGSSSIQFITVWLYVSNSTPWTNYNSSSLVNANVQGGSTFTLNVTLTATGVNSYTTYSFSSWLITTRGNTVALQQTIVSANNIIVSQTTQGIGVLMMDFPNFTYYNVSQSGPPYVLNGYPTGASGYLVNGATAQNAKIAFRVIITNLDQNQRNITLTAGSVLFSIFPDTVTQTRCAWWYIVNVNGTGAISNNYTTVTLVYNSATALYFASENPGTLKPVGSKYPGVTPVNLALVGQIGGIPFGQNIPFVSIYIAP